MSLLIKKTTLILLAIVLLSSSLSTRQASAYYVSYETNPILLGNIQLIVTSLTGVTPGAQADSNYVKTVGMAAAKFILRKLTESVVAWIDSGFEGNPAFITNTKQYLLDTADATVGDFLMNDPALEFLCDPFKIKIKLALGLQYRPFEEKIECSFTSALGNVENAMESFTNGEYFDWDDWLQITTVPQNNQMGALILAQGELDARIDANKDVATLEANFGDGFMSWKDCPDYDYVLGEEDYAARVEGDNNRINRYTAVTGEKRGDDGCVIKTPGGVIANKINWVDTSTLRELELANDINAILSALTNQVFLLGKGALEENGLLGGSKPKESTAYNDYMAYLAEQESSLNESDSSETYYNEDGSINFDQTFENQALALETIEAQVLIENQYISAQSKITAMLDAALEAFEESDCSTAIKTNIADQISGDYTGTKDLTWNKIDILRETTTANANIASLNAVATAVKSASSDSDVAGIVAPLKTLSGLHSSASVTSYSSGGTAYNNIKAWIINKISTNAGTCTVDETDLPE